ALQPRHLEGDLGAGAGAADEDAGAEPAQRVDREAEDLRHGAGLEREMRAAAGELADLGERFRAATLERVRRAELARERATVRQAVNRDDRAAPGDLRRHQSGEADAADAVNCD